MTKSHEERFPNWHELYQKQPVEEMPWYFKDLDHDLKKNLEKYGINPGKFLDIGTGPGTQAIAMHELGFEVTGSDLSEAAIKRLQKEAPSDMTFIQDDILNSKLTGSFDLIFDRGCFHCLHPEKRSIYSRTVKNLLSPHGFFFLKTFSVLQEEWEEGGPYRFDSQGIYDVFEDDFDIVESYETEYQGTMETYPKALFSVLRRRS